MARVSKSSPRGGSWHIPASLLIGLAIGLFIGNGTTPVAFPKEMLLVSKTAASVEGPSASISEAAPELDAKGQSGTGSPALLSQPGSQKNFLGLSRRHGTDKTRATLALRRCLENPANCKKERLGAENPKCLVSGHYYDSIYQRWLAPYSTDDAEPFQFLEIGFYHGAGFDTYSDFLPNAEKHSMEISCIAPGPREEGKWPFGNFAAKNRNYQSLVDAKRLHCIDASKYEELKQVWDTQMKRPDAPPLKVVVEDAAHLSHHMAMSLFFWFPRIAPGGLMFVEDIEPHTTANKFRTELLPQVIKDVHWCGLPEENGKNQRCFPTLQPLIKSVHCEMHVCVFERNDMPAIEYNETDSSPPRNTLDFKMCN